MCGICGILNFDGSPVDKEILESMSEVQFHRGPDEGGYYFSENVGLGHRRLSIIDLSAGKQPMSNEDGSVWITYNGETYNFMEIRETLKCSGHKFRTKSDTEVILNSELNF